MTEERDQLPQSAAHYDEPLGRTSKPLIQVISPELIYDFIPIDPNNGDVESEGFELEYVPCYEPLR
jgi:hypothetical protein